MQKVKVFKCPECGKVYNSLQTWSNHVQKQHPQSIPKGFTLMQYFYFLQTGKSGGRCVVCKNPTKWNEATGKYERFCQNPRCKEKYREMFKNRMINKYGKACLLDDPEQQRKMLEGKKNHGYVTFDDGGKIGYNSSYEKDFFEMMNNFMHCNSTDIISPSPHTYYYEYKNENDKENEGKKFYIPDAFIPSLNLEIEIKQNTSTHPKIIAIDKVKEACKDAMMLNLPGIRYIKITDKDYSEFFALLYELKQTLPEAKEIEAKPTSTMIATEGFKTTISDKPRDWDDTIKSLINWQKELVNYQYGYLYHNRIEDSDDGQIFFERYRSLTPENFIKYRGGVCWDYTAYEYHELYHKFNLASKCYYIELANYPNQNTHTFCVIPGKTFLYIEASYKRIAGVYEFRSLDELISFISTKMIEDCGTPAYMNPKIPDIVCYEYTPDNTFYELNTEQFMSRVKVTGERVRFTYNPNAKIKYLGGSKVTGAIDAMESYREGQFINYDIESDELPLYKIKNGEASENLLSDILHSPSEAEKYDILDSWKSKIFTNEFNALVGKTPPTTTRYITPMKVLVDDKRGIISIQNINFKDLIYRIRETFGEKRLDYIFDRTYKASDINLFNKKRISRSQMKITSFTTPVFFALELTIIFKELYQRYRYSQYASIAKQIYNQTWLKKADETRPESLNMSKLRNINPEYTLEPHQREFIEKYPLLKRQLNLRGYYLAFDQGLGKTLTACALAEVLDIDKVYIVCPNTLTDVWRDEIAKYFNRKYRSHICNMPCNTPNDVKFFITNLESIKNILPYINQSGKKMLIIDEAHNFRSWGGQRVDELISLREKLNPSDVLPMSGTPIKAIPNEMVPALKLLDPLFTDEAADIYNACFKFDSYLAMDIVKKRFGQVIYRKTKNEVLSLPNKYIEDKWFNIKNPDPYLMTNVKREVKEYFYEFYDEMSKDDGPNMERYLHLVKLYSTAPYRDTNQYIKLVTAVTNRDSNPESAIDHELTKHFFDTFLDTYVVNNPQIRPNEAKEVKELERKFVFLRNSAMGRAIGKVYPPRRNALFNALFDENKQEIENMIESNLKKTVIFSQLLPVVNHICDTLNADGISTVKVIGGTSDRMEIINQFRNDLNIKCIVATSQSMGTGVTLIEASQMFFFGPPWRSTDYDQCCDRIYRIGQTDDVHIYNVRLQSPQANLSDRMNKIMEWSSEMFHSAIDTDEMTNALEFAFYDNYDEIEEDVSDAIFMEEAYEYFDYYTSFLNENYPMEMDAAIEAAGYSEQSKNPVFILLTVGHSPLSGIIMKATGDSFSHSSISFDISLNPMYSFGTKKMNEGHREMGFVKTWPKDPLWDPKTPTPYSLYVTFVSDADFAKMKSRMAYFLKNDKNLGYSFAGLFRVFFHMKSPKRRNWFCSQFVAEVLSAGKSADMQKDASLYRPHTLKDIGNVSFLIKGDAIDKYEQREAAAALEKLKHTEGNVSDKELDEKEKQFKEKSIKGKITKVGENIKEKIRPNKDEEKSDKATESVFLSLLE